MGLPYEVVGGATIWSGGWGYHMEWWVGLLYAVMGGATMITHPCSTEVAEGTVAGPRRLVAL